jgi:DNA-binding NtrC family response regulator
MIVHRILLADPDARLLALYRAFLAQHGYEVETCSDGLGCLDRLRAFRPHLLVLDPDLPWGRGEGVLSLMADGDVPAAPVVLVAASVAAQRAFLDGHFPVRSVLFKPVTPDRLADDIRSALGAYDDPLAVPAAPPDRRAPQPRA